MATLKDADDSLTDDTLRRTINRSVKQGQVITLPTVLLVWCPGTNSGLGQGTPPL